MSRTLILFLLTFSTKTIGQPRKEVINPKYEKAPFFIAKSPIKLAKYLTENDSSEFQQALNIYTWIVNNIKYDVKASQKIKLKVYSPKQTLKRKKGICYQYSTLFAALCQNAGISSREIVGYSRGSTFHEDDLFYEADHSWNGVKLDSSWYLIDATWGSGGLHQKKRGFKELQFRWFKKPYVNDKYIFRSQPNYHYFLVNPASLIADHLPVDPNWQLLDFPISINTFESSGWRSYLPRMDSLYQKQIDAVEYVEKLNKYEYVSRLQYLQSTAKQSYLFNPRNSKLVGFSSFSIAKSYENASGSLNKRIDTYSQAIRLHKLATNQLKRHQKNAASASKKVIKKTKSRILYEFTKPISNGIKKNNRENKRALDFLNKEQKVVDSHKNKILKLQNMISRGSRPFTMPDPSRSEKPELVEQNRLKIESNLTTKTNYQDPALVLIRSLKANMRNRKTIQMAIVSQYRKLVPHTEININSIAQNQRLSQISISMHVKNSIGQIIDSLNIEKNDIDQLIRQEKSTIKQLHSSTISLSSEVRKLVIQNCQFSKNRYCEERLYNASNHVTKSIYETKKQLENEFLDVIKYDSRINKEMVKITGELHKALKTNANFISLFLDRRLGGISFKLKRSNFETSQLINESQKSLRRLTLEISHLKNEIRKNESV